MDANRVVLTTVAIDEQRYTPVIEALFPRGNPAEEVQARDEARLADVLCHTQVHTTVQVDVNFDNRFLCKLALALGDNILGKQHGESSYAEELRRGLWTRDPVEREKLRIRGTGMFGEAQSHALNETNSFMSWPGCWTILLKRHGDDLSACITTPSGMTLAIVIAERLSEYSEIDLEPYEEGQMFFISMPIATFVGPVPLPDVLAHKLGVNVSEKLAALELRTEKPPLPPKH